MDRRDILKGMGLTTATGALGLWSLPGEAQTSPSSAFNGLPSVKIKKVKSIVTCPHGIELIMVKVETDQPGLVGYGCATFRQRAHAVVAAIDDYLDDFCRDRSVENIEDIWQTILDHRKKFERSGELDEKRRKQALDWLWALVEEGLRERFYRNPAVEKHLPAIVKAVEKGETAPTAAAHRLLNLHDV